MSRKKILFLITKSNWGGAQRYVFDLATNLRGDFEPVVAFGNPGLLAEKLNTAGIRLVPIHSMRRDIAFWSDAVTLYKLVQMLRAERPDVIHLNSSKAAALGALAARLSGVPKIIFTVHGWPFKEQRNALARAFIYFVSWFTAFLSHAVIVVSRQDEAIGRRMPFIGEKIRYIPIGIEMPAFLPKAEAVEFISTKIPNEGFTKSIIGNGASIVTIAELTANKGIRCAIEAVAELKKRGTDVFYFVIGDGEEREPLLRLAQELNVADRVRFLGFVSDASKYFTAFDIFVLPSIKEGMPYVLLEAAAAGLPIVATDVVQQEASDIPNIYFVPPGDGHALADAVEKLANNVPAKKPSTVGTVAEMVGKTVALYR